MNDKQISSAIVGCGWLGFPLALKMIEKGISVNGSTTSLLKIKVLSDAGINPYLVNLPTIGFESDLLDVDYLVINIPPGRRNPNVLEDYPKTITQIIEKVKSIDCVKKIIFISSTSVYGSDYDLIDENTETIPLSDAGRALLLAEDVVKSSSKPFVILRFGGLAGPGRHPGRFLAGKSGLTSGNQFINFLHLDDAINAIFTCLSDPIQNEIFNVVAPEHPLKSDFYIKMAEVLHLDPPEFVSSDNKFVREISVKKFINRTHYIFIQPDPMKFTF